jgi:hypothetical protein
MRYPPISSPSGKGALFWAAIWEKYSLLNTAIVWINHRFVKNKGITQNHSARRDPRRAAERFARIPDIGDSIEHF